MRKDRRPRVPEGEETRKDEAPPSRAPGREGGHPAPRPGDPLEPDATRAGAESGEAAETTGTTPAVPVVGLGGSAGSLDSYKAFFEAMPPDSGAAFVVIQHLSPALPSLLAEVLARHTRMRVAQVEDGVPAAPDCVYIIPPDRDLSIRDGVLYLAEQMHQGGVRMPIDVFFRSLAEDRQERAVCVLFSGAGSDGTLGVRAVRGAGGLTIAQDPETALFGDMPRSAIATRMVDSVLPPDQMPGAIMDYLRHPYVRGGETPAARAAAERPGGLDDILAAVKDQTGCDFRCYKKSTILRRIDRRMGLRHIPDMARYSELLAREAEEVSQLFKDLLINVTAFFRDAGAFEELRRQVIVPLVHARQPDDPLRVWVPGCSSGEEAYSLVMLLLEESAAARRSCTIQVFATDIDEEALEFARQGIYPESIVADVGPARLSRFFIRREHGYQVGESLRNCVVFAVHNLITDPPFSRMDIISCRNLLIYLDGDTQAKLLPLFNFALNRGGYLFLGKSEGATGQPELFSLISKKARLYRRVTPAWPIVLDSPILPGRKRAAPPGASSSRPPAGSYADAIRQALLSHFAASVVLVDRGGQILQFHGQTGKYLNMPSAEPILNLLDTAKGGLALRLRSAMHAVLNEGKPVALDPVALTREEGAPLARVTVAPLALARRDSSPAARAAPSPEAEPLLAVIFEDVPRPAVAREQPAAAVGGGEAAIRQLEDELRIAQQDLQASVEEMQAANEELRVSHEEVVCSNEELQSTNEELETSKEELQSVNEELTTVNSQLQDKIERLDTANRDIANLLRSTRIATLFLDQALRIKLYTPAATRVLSLIPSDLGRPIGDLAVGFGDYDLAGDVLAVARGGEVIERHLRHADGSYYLVRIVPYLAEADQPEGVVATFDDVTRLRKAEEQTRQLATVVKDSNDAVILFDVHGGVQTWNRGAQEIYGWSEVEALRLNLRDLTPPEEAERMHELFRRLLAGEAIPPFETRHRARDGRVLDIWLTVTAVPDESGRVAAMAITCRDVTGRKRAELEREMASFLRLANAASGTADLVRAAAAFFQERSGCEAVGVRLKEGEDYPYCEARGFPEEFIRLGNSLCAPDAARQPPGGGAGYPNLECMCRDVIQGRFDPSQPFFTARGNFWSNCTTELPATSSETDRPARRRNRCNGKAYESVALIALRVGGECLGLLQLNDKRRNRFSPEAIALWELLADHLAVALARTRAEEEARQSRERLAWLARLPEENPNPVLRVSPEGTVLYRNPASARLPGWNCEVGRPLPGALPALLERTMAQGQPVNQDVEMGGTVYDVWVAPVAAEGYANVYGRDITERKRAEEALRESEEKYRIIVETASEGIWITDAERKTILVNQRLADMLGFTTEELRNRTPSEFVDAGQEELMLEARGELAAGASISREFRFRRRDGSCLWAISNASPVLDDQGCCCRTVSMLTDISERKRAEEALRQSEEHFRALAEALPQVVWTADAEGGVEWCNRRWYEYTGEPEGGGGGWNWGQVAHPDDLAPTLAKWAEARAGGALFQNEIRIRCHDGQYHWFLVRAWPLQDAAGRVLRWFGTNTDIHDLKATENALRQAAADLKRSNQDLQQFAHVAGHDLQEPLRMVSGFLTLLEDRYRPQLDAKAREYIDFATEGAQRMSQLIADLIAYSRVERMGGRPEPADAGSALAAALANLRGVIRETGATVTHEELPTVDADATQLTQLFQNLVGNAVKFGSPDRPSLVHVSARRQAAKWLFAVRDNGIGITPDQFDRIFDIFQRLHTRDKYPGTGIGLAICKRIIERHGGRIWVESKVDEGSTFFFTL